MSEYSKIKLETLNDIMDNDASSDSGKRQRVEKRRISARIVNPMLKHYDSDEKAYYQRLSDLDKLYVASLEQHIHDLNKDDIPLRFKILLSKMEEKIKAIAIKRLQYVEALSPTSSEYFKTCSWIESLCKLPIGRYENLPVCKSSTVPEIRGFVRNVKAQLDATVYGHADAKDHIIRLIAQWISNPVSKGLVLGIHGAPGTGKCLAVDTPVLMYDGSIMLVQEIRVGDMLMGDDHQPRRVLNLGRGVSQLYKVRASDDRWDYTVNGEHILCLKGADGKVHELTVNEYLSLPRNEASLLHGYSLEDGLGATGKSCRIAVLTRMLKTGGRRTERSTVTYTSDNSKNVEHVAFLARSLGMFCSVDKARTLTIFGKHVGLLGVPHDTQQSGDGSVSIDIEAVGSGEYYGFTIDGNGRFVLGNFVVTHNTSLVKDGICKALGLPFAFVALGGATDGSYLDGHSYTYEGSTWGKIVDIVMKAGVMNPVLYFDELDKVSGTYKGEEIINILVHLTDSTQNDRYQDKYFMDIDFDMSRCLMIFSYNDESTINPILKDRMVRIKTKGYTQKEKVIIAKQYLIKDLLTQFNFAEDSIRFSDDVIGYIASRIPVEEGVRNLKRALECIISNINLKMLLTDEEMHFPMDVTYKTVDTYVKHIEDMSYKSMYI